MRADTTSLTTLFARDVQYRVPVYQRPYVWTREKQWQPLLDDLCDLVDGELAASGNGRPSPPPHFMGAVVLDAIDTSSNAFEARSVIDGQQRLTTLQLVIGAAVHVLGEHDLVEPARVLGKLIHNDPDLVSTPDDSFKVLPTNANRTAYRLMMGPEGPDLDAPDEQSNQIQEAFLFFVEGVSQWLGREGSAPETLRTRSLALRDALRQKVKLVLIDLEPGDDPQVIFETLNDRGTPLLKIELVKNFVFQRASKEQLSLEALNETMWKRFDEDRYWRTEVGVGRYSIVRAELFLMHWLTMKLLDEVKVPHLFARFRELFGQDAQPPVEDVVAEFVQDSEVFRGFDDWQEGSIEHRFFRRLTTLDTSTAFPLILLIMRQPVEILTPERRQRALRVIESWLVRRGICRLTPKNYNRYFIELTAAVRDDLAAADDVLLQKLANADADTNTWPRDEALDEVLLHLPIYKKQLTIARTRMLLEAAEEQLRGHHVETQVVPSGLSIEHVMPQQWREHWDTDPPMAAEAANERDQRIDRLGNLTLVTQPLNSSVSNGQWSVKKDGLEKHSVLYLNRHVVSHQEGWSEEAIDARSAAVASRIKAAWPGPESDVWQ